MPSARDVLAACLVVAASVASGSACAQEAADPATRAAELAQEALAHYEAGAPAEAIPLLIEARELYPEPLLTYNLARAYEALGRREEALAAYRRYVAERPDAPDRAAMETHIASLEAQIEERARLAREREEERRRRELAEARAAEASGPSPWSILVLAGGGGLLGAGLVFGILARSERDEAQAEVVHATRVSRGEDAERLATVANVLFGVGGALAVAGATWLTVELVSRRRARAATLALTPFPGGLSLSGTF
ncbi:MAG: hypothetical protein CMN30_10175 [Sandaracinus sp.]|nr:hypothetical protein [Sandaracinus sp.]